MDGIVDIQLAHLEKLLADRKIALELDDRRATWLADARLRPGLRRAAAEAGDPARAAGPAGAEDPRGQIPDGATVHVTATPLGLMIGDGAPTAMAAQ